MSQHITYDPVYNTVDRDDFRSMLDVERYGQRSSAFDAIVAATHDHFWDPMDPAYVDFTAHPMNLAEETIMPMEFSMELNCAVADRLDDGQKIRLANEVTRWSLSSLLHGEQGALSLSASLCHVLRDPGALEYASNQAREEARHVTAFSRYIQARFGTPYPCGETLGNLMNELVLAPEVYKKLVGMQLLIEGLAMGAFATLHTRTRDPLLSRMIQLVMTDEAFHHRFGKIWSERTVPHLTEEQHAIVEQWAADCFQKIFFNLVNAEQKKVIYGQFGLDWQWVRGAVQEAFTDKDRRALLRQNTNVFRVLIKTLLHAGIITERTRPLYAMWVDMDELQAEGDASVGDAIAEEGIASLREINRARRPIGRALRQAPRA